MTTYKINEQMLGDEATVEDAKRMVALLKERGYAVEYGDSIGQNEDEISDVDWQECLDIIAAE